MKKHFQDFVVDGGNSSSSSSALQKAMAKVRTTSLRKTFLFCLQHRRRGRSSSNTNSSNGFYTNSSPTCPHFDSISLFYLLLRAVPVGTMTSGLRRLIPSFLEKKSRI